MSFVEKSIKCSDCGSDFTFSVSEQEFFAEKGFTHDPRRCRLCRAQRAAQGDSSAGYRPPRRQMFRGVCAECGKETQLPFEPRGGRRVYCADCYSRIKEGAAR